MNAMIEVSNLTKRFGSVAAVDNVSFEVRAGELLTLLGPSGCGKTTLLRLLSGFEEPTGGAIRIDGADVTLLPPNRRDVNQVFQSYALFPHLTARENVAFGLKMQRQSSEEIKRKVGEVLSLVALEGMEDRHPHELSGGQRQRVALARAIVPNPRILLLDEPLSALDAKLRRSMQLEIKRLQKQLGLTTILVTHDQDEALALSDRIAVMNAGRIAQLDTPERIYRFPADAFVAEFIGEANVFPARILSRGESGGGSVWCELNVGETITFQAKVGAGAKDFGIGEACRISVRPESIRVVAAAPSASLAGSTGSSPPSLGAADGDGTVVLENVFRARLVEKIFLGATVRATVELLTTASPGSDVEGRDRAVLRFTVFEAASSYLGSAALGAALICSCGADDVVLLS